MGDLLSEGISLELRDIAPWEPRTALIQMFVLFSISTKPDSSWTAIFSSFENVSALWRGVLFPSSLVPNTELSSGSQRVLEHSQETKPQLF